MPKQTSGLGAFLGSRWGIGVVVILGITALLLTIDHWTHIAKSNLVLAGALMACAVMHLVMHGGHGGNTSGRR